MRGTFQSRPRSGRASTPFGLGRPRMLAIAAALLGGLGAQAQTFPNQPLRIVIGFPPGGAIDTIARVMAPKMAADLGQNVVVENRAGAGGVIGMQAVARAKPDGYTLFMGTMGNFSITPALVRDLPYRVGQDFAPITQVASASMVLFTTPDLPVRTVSDLVAYAKANPQKVNFSSSGNGGIPHMAGEMFNAAAGLRMTHVAYKGSAPSITDVVGGQVQLTFEAAAIGLPHVQAGRLRALATTGTARMELLPEVATVAETLPGFDVRNWFGLAAPAGTTADRIDRIRRSVSFALGQPDTRASLAGLGVDAVDDGPAAFTSFIRSETGRWQRLIAKQGIKAD